jgi:hypothetical protein
MVMAMVVVMMVMVMVMGAAPGPRTGNPPDCSKMMSESSGNGVGL